MLKYREFLGRLVFCLLLVGGITDPLVSQIRTFNIESSRKVGSLFRSDGTLLGTCFCVDVRGYVATSFSNIVDSKDVYVQLADGQRGRVTGFVAASRGKDIAILEVVAVVKRESLQIAPLKCNRDAEPQLDEILVPWGGPNSPAIPPTAPLSKVTRKLLGEEFCAGLTAPPNHRVGIAPDLRWLWLDQPRDLSCNGAPVFNEKGEVVAMLSNSLSRGQVLFTAIHIQHVVEMIPERRVKPRELKALANWQDLTPEASPPDPIPSEDSAQERSLAGQLRHALPLADRLDDFVHRSIRIENEKSEIGKKKNSHNARILENAAEIERVQGEIAAIRPEEPYETTETRRERKTRTVTKTRKDREGKDEKYEVDEVYFEDVEVKVTRYRLSARQLAIVNPLIAKRDAMQQEIVQWNQELGFITVTLEPYFQQLSVRTEYEAFYLADPLGLRSAAEHQAFESKLSSRIEEGDATAIEYLQRAIARMHLKNLEGAESDLKDVVDISPALRPLANALEALRDLLAGDKNRAMANMKSLLSDNEDARLLLVSAKMNLEAQKWVDALRNLKEASKLDPLEIDIQQGIAWVSLVQPTFNSQQAIDAGMQAVFMSGGRDWNAMAALAAVHARAKKKELAAKELEAAIQIAPDFAEATCDQWRSDLKLGKPILPDLLKVSPES